MATATVTSRDAGIHHCMTGSFTGDATATTITLGFNPRWVKVFNGTDAIMWEWVEGMAATVAFKTVTAGTTTADTGTAISVSGGVLTLSATLAASAKAISWVAVG